MIEIATCSRRTRAPLQGFTLLEVIIAVSIFAMMFLVLFTLHGATRTMTRTGETQVVPQTTVKVKEKPVESVILPDGATIDEVVRGLRALGVSARDIISILQAIKSAGAMNADLEMQ